ncbi:hypothetical protein BaRGS_00001269, partial [Batillaria attramentaria]
MASGDPPSGGYGRGGRGLAILEALKKEQQGPGRGAGMGRGVLSLGRAAALQAAQQAAAQPQPGTEKGAVASAPPAAVSAPAPTPAQPMGRGNIAGMLAMMQSSGQLGGRGRGAALAQAAVAAQQKPATTPQAPQPAPVPSVPRAATPAEPQQAAPGPVPPSAAMSRMGLHDDSRKPTVSRPGTGGKPMQLATNYVRLHAKNKNVFQYHVDFHPVVDSKAMRCGLLNEHRDLLKVKLFDGTIMYMPDRLNDETILKSVRKTDGAIITITIRLTKLLPSEQCPQLYNIMLRRVMSILNMCQVGRYYYNPATPSDIPAHNLEVWPGYITAIKEHEGGLFLLLDSSHRVLRTQTVRQIIEEIATRNRNFHDEITRKIVGCTVLTRYNNKTYRIDDIDWGKTPAHTFDTAQGPISFQEYYWNQYGKKVDANQPLLVHRPKARKINGRMVQPRTEIICLIPELCYLTGLTDDMRADFTLMKDLSAHTRVSPNQRLMTMKKFVDSVRNNPEASQQLQNWGLELDDSALAVEGRQLSIETIMMDGNTKFSAGPQADFGRDVCRNRVLTAVDIGTWQIFYWRRNAPEVNNFIQEAIKAGAQMGMRVQTPIRVELADDKTETLIKAMRTNLNPKIQLVVPVMPTSRDDKYSAIKKFCCVEHPVPSQVIVHRTIRNDKKLRSVTQKIMLQINCKLGGELWMLKIPLERLMVVGIDSFHDVAHGKRSIGGFVASTNSDCTRWYSHVCMQMKSEELLPGLQMAFTAALRKYHEANHFLPEKIIVFRDGVGDGQLNVVSDYEVRQMESSFSHWPDYHPRLSVIIVQKRINTRIFLRANGSNLDNPPPGTVLDHSVTRRD